MLSAVALLFGALSVWMFGGVQVQVRGDPVAAPDASYFASALLNA